MHRHKSEGEQLRIYMRMNKITQDALAKEYRVSRNTIVNYLKEEILPPEFKTWLLNNGHNRAGAQELDGKDPPDQDCRVQLQIAEARIREMETTIELQKKIINMLEGANQVRVDGASKLGEKARQSTHKK